MNGGGAGARWPRAVRLGVGYSALALGAVGVRWWRDRPDWRVVGQTAAGDTVFVNVRRPVTGDPPRQSWTTLARRGDVRDAGTADVDCSARVVVSQHDVPPDVDGLYARLLARVCGGVTAAPPVPR